MYKRGGQEDKERRWRSGGEKGGESQLRGFEVTFLKRGGVGRSSSEFWGKKGY